LRPWKPKDLIIKRSQHTLIQFKSWLWTLLKMYFYSTNRFQIHSEMVGLKSMLTRNA